MRETIQRLSAKAPASFLLGVRRMEKVVIWVRLDGRRMRVGSSIARLSPLPFGAIPITECYEYEKRIMLKWIQKRLDRGWSIEKIKAACD